MFITDSKPESSTSHGGYIPSIEGMRALAVFAVLLFHLDIKVFGGGFLGVDLFFVISGFIITRNILFDHHGKGFSLKEFYIRRFRRLFPALLVTVLVTLVIATAIMPPAELSNTGRSAIYALFSVANLSFWADASYFDAAAATKPLLHTWSLSVEEQFYLFWPALLLIFVNTRWRLYLALGVLSLSLCSAFLLRDSMPSGIFYLLPFRAHQLMAGALVAILSLRLSSMLGNCSVLVGTVSFLYVSVAISGEQSPFLGAASVSALGFLLLLGRETKLAQILYGNQFMIWVGKRSYAIYLVHWPLIVLFKYSTDFHLGILEIVFLLVCTLIAAVILHELVEKPFRKTGEDSTPLQTAALPITVFTLLATLFVGSNIWGLDGLLAGVDPRIQKVVDSVSGEHYLRRQITRTGKCDLYENDHYSDFDISECATINPDRKNVLLIGDSLAADIYMMLRQNYDGIHLLQATGGGCTGLLDLTYAQMRFPACQQLNELRFEKLVELDVDLVVLASIWTIDRIGPLKDTVEYLQSRGKKVLVIGPRVEYPAKVPLLISMLSSLAEANTIVGNLAVKNEDILEEMRLAMPGMTIIDIARMQCSPSCDVLDGDRLLFLDHIHLTKLGAKRVGKKFKESFDLLAFINAPFE